MNCPNCQYPLPMDITVCPNCGTIIPQNEPDNLPAYNNNDYNNPQSAYDPQSYFAEPQQQPDYPVSTPNPPQKNSTPTVIIAIAAVLVVVIVAVAAVLITRNSGNNSDGPDVKPASSSSYEDDDDDDETTAAAFKQDTGADSKDDSPTNVTGPDEMFYPETYYVIEPTGILLKSGPSDSTNTLHKINYESAIDIRGGQQGNDDWVYIYYGDADTYGWVDTSKISKKKPSTVKPSDIQAPTKNIPVIYYEPRYGAYVDVGRSDKHLNLRAQPSTAPDVEIRELMNHGDYITVHGYYQNDPNWLYIEHNGRFGFAHSKYVSQSKPSSSTYNAGTYSEYSDIQYKHVYTPNNTGLYLRTGPSKSYKDILLMPHGSYVEVLGRINGSSWVYLRYYSNGNSYSGYADGDYLR